MDYWVRPEVDSEFMSGFCHRHTSRANNPVAKLEAQFSSLSCLVHSASVHVRSHLKLYITLLMGNMAVADSCFQGATTSTLPW